MYSTVNVHCRKPLHFITDQTKHQHETHKYDLENLSVNSNGFYHQMKTDHLNCMFVARILTLGDY